MGIKTNIVIATIVGAITVYVLTIGQQGLANTTFLCPLNDCNCPSYVYGQQAKETLMTTLPYQEKACNNLGGQPAIFTIHQLDINAPLVLFMCLKDINN